MKKIILLVGVLVVIEENQVLAATFDVTNGATVTAGQSLAAGQSGTVENGGTLAVSGSTVAITVTGNASIVNNGSISQSGTGRGIRDNTGGLTLSVTNNAGASIVTNDADVIQMAKPTSNVAVNNYGTLTSTNASAGGAQAIDFNSITSGSNVLHNFATGVISANEADAVRPGTNGFVYNDGLIKSTNNPGSTSGSDGVDAQTLSGITIVNATTGNATTPGSGTIEGARHGITGGNTDTSTDGTYLMSITNNQGGSIKGDNGAGINIDGFSAKEVVTIVNHGSITGNGVTGDGDGVDVDGVVNLTNSGTIRSIQANNDTSEGVTVGGGTIVNSGTIEGDNINGGVGRGITLAGIDKDANGNPIPVQGIYTNTSITNSGLIKGQSDAGIALTGAGNAFTVTITNQAGGVIEGGGSTAAAISTGGNNATIINYGVITADASGKAIALGSGNSNVQILGGAAVVNGGIDGGTGISSLSITPGAGNTFSYDGVISNFSSVQIGSGTTRLNGASTYTAATQLTGGTVVIGNNNAIGSGVLVSNNGTVAYANGVNLGNAISLAGNSAVQVDGTDSAIQSGAISAPGGSFVLTKQGTGTLIFNGTGAVANTQVAAGTLEIGDSNNAAAVLSSNVQVANAGTLRGHGSINGDVTNAGVVRPGGSVGTLTINGNYTQASSGTLLIDVSPSGASQLKVNGTASLGGTLQLLYGPGTYAPASFKVLSANNVVGNFATVTGNTPTGYTQSASVGADGVDLGLTATQDTAPTQPVVVAPTNATLFGAMASSALLQSQRQNDVLLQHRASGAQDEVSGWVQAEGQHVHTDGNNGAPGYKDEHIGVLAGAETQRGAFTLGDAVGFSHSRIEENGSGAYGNINALSLHGYARTDAAGVQFSGTVGAAYDFLSSTRPFATLGQATADSHAAEFRAGAQAAMPFALGSAFSIIPRAGLRYAYYHGSSLSESGQTSQNLSVGTQNLHSLQPYVGTAFGYALATEGDRHAQLQAGLIYAYETLSTSRASNVTALDGTGFVVEGTAPSRGLLTASVGVQWPVGKAMDIYLNYDGLINTGNATAQAVNAGVSYRF